MFENETETSDRLAEELHRLDAELDKLRRRIVWLERTLVSPEESAELKQLKQRYDEVAGRFIETYRRWNRQA